MRGLRPYQVDAIQEARDRVAAGRIAPLLVAPTGAGKTVIEAAMIRSHLEIDANHRVVVVAHRRELIGQIASTLVRMGVTDIGEICPGVIQRPSARVQVASTQTLRARNLFPPASLLVFDEAHHYSSDDWHQLTRGYPGVVRVGFTATPMRSDGRGMAPAFDSLVVVSTIKELTAQGHLVACKVIAPAKPLKRPNMTHAPVDAYLAHAHGARTVVFADFVINAEKFVAEFRDKGVDAVVIHGDLSDDDRARALQAHARGAVLVNCMVLTEGWDSPETACCILARGCGSVSTYLQIVGRVLRPCGKCAACIAAKADSQAPRAKCEKQATLIDLTGRSFYDHGAPDDDRTYSLTGKGIRSGDKDAEPTYCPVCGQPVEEPPNSWPCPVCGHQPEGQIEAPRYTGDELAERYATKRKEDDPKKIETLARWFAEAKARMKTGQYVWAAIAKYRAVYGSAPSQEIRFAAEQLSKTLACVQCTQCNAATARTYAGGKCGRCAFGKTKAK
jgi:DNA repair protein RadD